jgi:hypothetical protein
MRGWDELVCVLGIRYDTTWSGETVYDHGTRTPDDLRVWLYTSYGPSTAKLPMMNGMND